jgi:hypothetical protein
MWSKSFNLRCEDLDVMFHFSFPFCFVFGDHLIHSGSDRNTLWQHVVNHPPAPMLAAAWKC